MATDLGFDKKYWYSSLGFNLGRWQHPIVSFDVADNSNSISEALHVGSVEDYLDSDGEINVRARELVAYAWNAISSAKNLSDYAWNIERAFDAGDLEEVGYQLDQAREEERKWGDYPTVHMWAESLGFELVPYANYCNSLVYRPKKVSSEEEE